MSNILITFLTVVSITLHIQYKTKSPLGKDFIGIATCSAVMISENEALTAAHCMENSTGHLWALDSNEKSFSVTVEKINKKMDLCLVKLNSPISHSYASLGHYVNKGNFIASLNSGNDFIGTYVEGKVSNIIKDPENGVISIIHSATILPGASGSGLFNYRGQLIGINTAMYHNLSNAVDITEINYFLTGQVR